jgi:hypothetical protein
MLVVGERVDMRAMCGVTVLINIVTVLATLRVLGRCGYIQ